MPAFPTGVQEVVPTVPVKAVACEEPLMVEHLREAMKEGTYPAIVYHLKEPPAGNDVARAAGTLTIAGVTKPMLLAPDEVWRSR